MKVESSNFQAVAETWCRVWGGRNFFSLTSRFLNDIFSEKMYIFTPKISDDFFSHRPDFSDFTFLYCIKCRIRPFLHKKNHYFSEKNSLIRPFFTLFVLSRASDNTTSLNIGGPMHGP